MRFALNSTRVTAVTTVKRFAELSQQNLLIFKRVYVRDITGTMLCVVGVLDYINQ